MIGCVWPVLTAYCGVSLQEFSYINNYRLRHLEKLQLLISTTYLLTRN